MKKKLICRQMICTCIQNMMAAWANHQSSCSILGFQYNWCEK